jgi:hypothetical protein
MEKRKKKVYFQVHKVLFYKTYANIAHKLTKFL